MAQEHMENVCQMHIQFLKGMFQVLFTDVELIEGDNIIKGCESCSYQAVIW